MQAETIVAVLGHVDHGKTALIKALSGIDCDTRPEEKARGMTMEPGFAYLKERARSVALIDLPGHERFESKTASGLTGADFAMLVIDANEGIKPQTLSHLKMARWLGVRSWIAVLARSDLFRGDAAARLQDLVEDLIQKLPGLPEPKSCHITSIYDPKSLKKLRETLFSLPVQSPITAAKAAFRIDRHFHKKGVGSIIAGTLRSGSITVGNRLFVPEIGMIVRVKAMQRHGEAMERAAAPCRVAAAVEREKKDLALGALVTGDSKIKAYETIEAALETDDRGRLPKHGADIFVVVGAGRWPGRLYYYDDETVRVALQKPIALRFGEPFLVFSADGLVAGAKTLSPLYDPLRKRIKKSLLKSLRRRDFHAAFTLLAQNHPHGFGLLNASWRFGLDVDDAMAVARSIPGFFFDETAMKLYRPETVEGLKDEMLQAFETKRFVAVSIKMLRRNFGWAGEGLLQEVLTRLKREGCITHEGALYFEKGYDLTGHQKIVTEALLKRIEKAGIHPPAPNALFDRMGIDREWGRTLIKSLCDQKRITALGEGLYAASSVAEEFLDRLKAAARDGIDIQRAKRLFGLSRKESVAWLERLDTMEGIVNIEGKRYGRRGRESNPPSDGHPPDRRV